MDEVAESYLCIEKIVVACKSIKESLVCGICLEYFKEPVTIRCGHKFCRGCIFKVATNEHATCPFCNIKIQKRSIPKQGNKLVQSIVHNFQDLVESIKNDSGIDVFDYSNLKQPTKNNKNFENKKDSEKALIAKELFSSKDNISNKARSKSSQSVKATPSVSKKLSLRRKSDTGRKTPTDKNTLDKYLTNKSEHESEGQYNDKVTQWLESCTPVISDSIEQQNLAEKNVEEPNDTLITEQLAQTVDIPDIVDKETENSNKVEESKFSNTQKQIEQAEMNARRKKSKQNSSADKSTAKTPPTVPAASHSDINDWRRVKRVGKEMQIKTFKSLSVSIERNVSSSNLDENTLPDEKYLRKRKSKNEHQSPNFQNLSKDNEKNNIEDFNNPDNINDIIDASPMQNALDTPEQARTSLSTARSTNKLRILTPLKTKEDDDCRSIQSDDSSSNYRRSKLSLKLKLKSSKSSKPPHQETILPPKESANNIEANKFQSKTTSVTTSLIQPLTSNTNRPLLVPFKKLGKIVKKKKNIPFLYLGRTKPKEKIVELVFSSFNDFEASIQKDVLENRPACIDAGSHLTNKNNIEECVPQANSESTKDDNKNEEKNDAEIKSDSSSPIHNTSPLKTANNIARYESVHTTSNKNIQKSEVNTKNGKNNEAEVESDSGSSINATCIYKNNGKVDYNKSLNQTNSKSNNNEIENKKKIESEIESDSESFIDNVRVDNNTIIRADDKKSMSKTNIKTTNMELKSKGKIEAEIESDSGSSVYAPSLKRTNKKTKMKTLSTTSGSEANSPLRKKRSYSESSIEEDVVSIIHKWTDEPLTKIPKSTPDFIDSSQIEKKKNSRRSSGFKVSNKDKTLVSKTNQQASQNTLEEDPPIDNIINKVKSFKDNDAASCKINHMPSSLMSADLFETNDLQASENIYSKASKNDNHDEIDALDANEIEHSLINTSHSAIDNTAIDVFKNKRKKMNTSTCSNESNKENEKMRNNSKLVHITAEKSSENVNNKTDIFEVLPDNNKATNNKFVDDSAFNIPDSLINITAEQMALKNIEKELMDYEPVANTGAKNVDECADQKFMTPKKVHLRNREEEEYDSENIGATPVVKRRRPMLEHKSHLDMPDLTSLEPEPSLIPPTITPLRTGKIHPLCHSTPLTENPNSIHKTALHNSKKMILICSGLPPESIKVIQEFAKKFDGEFKNQFSPDVTHVIVQTNPKTKAGQKTFKYIQGIAYQKYVISFLWVIDCLKSNTILDEDDEKYDVLDPELNHNGAKRSRLRIRDLFTDFAVYCFEPFSNFSITDFKDLLAVNNARVVEKEKDLLKIKKGLKLIILESENLTQQQLSTLKKCGSAIVSFEWVVDCLSQYQILSLAPYLCETTKEEALALGYPPGILVEEEEEEDDEDDDEEDEEN